MQTPAPPPELITNTIIASASACAVGCVFGALAGTRKPSSVVRTLLIGTGAASSVIAAFGLLLKFQSFPVQRAVDRTPWAIALGCALAVCVSCVAHMFRLRLHSGSRTTAKLLCFAGIGILLRIATIVSALIVTFWRSISHTWSLGDTCNWIGSASVLGAIAWTMIDNAARTVVDKDDMIPATQTSRFSTIDAVFSVFFPMLIGTGTAAALLLDAGLSRFPPALGASFAGMIAMLVTSAVVQFFVSRRSSSTLHIPTRGITGVAIVVLTTVWLVGMRTSYDSAWTTPTKPAFAGVCILLAISLPSVIATIVRGRNRIVRIVAPLVVAAVMCGTTALILNFGQSQQNATEDWENW